MYALRFLSGRLVLRFCNLSVRKFLNCESLDKSWDCRIYDYMVKYGWRVIITVGGSFPK